MTLANTTYVTTLKRLDYGRLVEEAILMLRSNPAQVLESSKIMMTIVSVKVNNLDFTSASVGSQLGEVVTHAKASDIPEEGLTLTTSGEMDIRKYDVRFGKKFTHPGGKFDLFVPTQSGLLYVIQSMEEDRPFIQWAVHEHSAKKQRIIREAEYALFKIGKDAPVSNLAALIKGSDVLMMGDAQIGTTGYFKKEELLH